MNEVLATRLGFAEARKSFKEGAFEGGTCSGDVFRRCRRCVVEQMLRDGRKCFVEIGDGAHEALHLADVRLWKIMGFLVSLDRTPDCVRRNNVLLRLLPDAGDSQADVV